MDCIVGRFAKDHPAVKEIKFVRVGTRDESMVHQSWIFVGRHHCFYSGEAPLEVERVPRSVVVLGVRGTLQPAGNRLALVHCG